MHGAVRRSRSACTPSTGDGCRITTPGRSGSTLRDWVEWFTVRYDVPVSVVPNCWWRHGALVEELSALHVAHLAAFDASDAGFGADRLA